MTPPHIRLLVAPFNDFLSEGGKIRPRHALPGASFLSLRVHVSIHGATPSSRLWSARSDCAERSDCADPKPPRPLAVLLD